MKNIFSPARVNYLYFGFLFVCLVCLHALHVLVIENTIFLSRAAFLVDAVLQSLLEVAFLLLIGLVVRHYFSQALFFTYIALTFLLLVVHVVDFILVRVMDLSFLVRFAHYVGRELEKFYRSLEGHQHLSLLLGFDKLTRDHFADFRCDLVHFM